MQAVQAASDGKALGFALPPPSHCQKLANGKDRSGKQDSENSFKDEMKSDAWSSYLLQSQSLGKSTGVDNVTQRKRRNREKEKQRMKTNNALGNGAVEFYSRNIEKVDKNRADVTGGLSRGLRKENLRRGRKRERRGREKERRGRKKEKQRTKTKNTVGNGAIEFHSRNWQTRQKPSRRNRRPFEENSKRKTSERRGREREQRGREPERKETKRKQKETKRTEKKKKKRRKRKREEDSKRKSETGKER